MNKNSVDMSRLASGLLEHGFSGRLLAEWRNLSRQTPMNWRNGYPANRSKRARFVLNVKKNLVECLELIEMFERGTEK